jgi:hypothetical protein
MTVEAVKKEVSRFLGTQKIKRKPKLEPELDPYPWRSYALGQGGNSTQGIAGWRQSYHRPDASDEIKVYEVIYDKKGRGRRRLIIHKKGLKCRRVR